MTDPFTPYETGLARLLERLGKDHPRYVEGLALQSRLLGDIAQARCYGDTETRRAERAQILDALNRLALNELQTSFNELCGVVRRIQLILEGELSDFTDERRGTLQRVLASVLQVEPADVRILRVQPGSIRVIVEVPAESLTQLNSLSRADKSLLVSIGIEAIESDVIGTPKRQSGLPLLVRLFFNFAIVIVLALVLGPPASLPCVSPQASAVSLAVIILLLCHLVWRYLGSVTRAVGDMVKVGPFAVPIRVLTSLFDALHLWIPSNRALWVLVIALSLTAGILGLSPLSPFPIRTEKTPIVQNFAVQYLDRDRPTMSFRPGDVIEIIPGEQVLVQAEILGPGGTLCTWFTTHGNLLPAEGCSILYSAPFYGTRDGLVILAQSPCKTQDACASLHVTVVLHNQ